ncbi:MAG: outer membrane protein assembly factor BamA [Bacteroidota bacterium]|nr:outer membrane protein assembly factor BamA [Bacteroidota bacterium]
MIAFKNSSYLAKLAKSSLLIISLILSYSIKAQLINNVIDYSKPQEYEVGGITVSGIQFLDNQAIINLTGIKVGEIIKIPGDKTSKAIENLWKQGLFSEISINASKIQGNLIFLDFALKEMPRLSHFSIKGVKKGEVDDIKDAAKLVKGDVVTDNLKINAITKIKKHYHDKGYYNVQITINQIKDTVISNHVMLDIIIKKNNKVKIHKINFHGNDKINDKKLKRAMKDTKERQPLNVFRSSKFIEEDFKNDKVKLIERYNSDGYRDAVIVSDTFYRHDNKTVDIDIKVNEGRKYYFRNITWTGNTKYSSSELSSVLKIKKGDVYNQTALESNLYMSQDSRDISSLYLDDGYLFFSVTPVEVLVENDSIDLEMRIYEGKQARINKVTITGNNKTNDNVIMREIRTKPGQLFSRADIIRSQRELAQLRYFNAEKLAVNPKPNPADGTVDIEYGVEETSSDQVELSGGWGGGRVIGTLGVSFNNFSAKNFFNKDAWRPLPSGDGQKLSLRAQSNGLYYQSYNASFTEPWLGGKKPNALSTAVYYSIQTNGVSSGDPTRQSITIIGTTVGLGRRLNWPDDFFTLYNDVSYQHYYLDNYLSTFLFSDGVSNNLSFSTSIGRNSVDQPIYPRYGSDISLTFKFTPPYSLFTPNKDYSSLTAQEKYKWIEYHKTDFSASWFTKLIGNLVVNTRTKFGFLGLYDRRIGASPFERYYLGGDGLTGYALDGRTVIGLRGYSNTSLTPSNSTGYIGGTIYNKYTLELRYPISLNPSATIYVLSFLEAGNSWLKFKEFNPFDVKRSAGVGIRLFLPMFGQIGLDWGYGFDNVTGNASAGGSQFHFSIGQTL